jgi:hypothetical protein
MCACEGAPRDRCIRGRPRRPVDDSRRLRDHRHLPGAGRHRRGGQMPARRPPAPLRRQGRPVPGAAVHPCACRQAAGRRLRDRRPHAARTQRARVPRHGCAGPASGPRARAPARGARLRRADGREPAALVQPRRLWRDARGVRDRRGRGGDPRARTAMGHRGRRLRGHALEGARVRADRRARVARRARWSRAGSAPARARAHDGCRRVSGRRRRAEHRVQRVPLRHARQPALRGSCAARALRPRHRADRRSRVRAGGRSAVDVAAGACGDRRPGSAA